MQQDSEVPSKKLKTFHAASTSKLSSDLNQYCLSPSPQSNVIFMNRHLASTAEMCKPDISPVRAKMSIQSLLAESSGTNSLAEMVKGGSSQSPPLAEIALPHEVFRPEISPPASRTSLWLNVPAHPTMTRTPSPSLIRNVDRGEYEALKTSILKKPQHQIEYEEKVQLMTNAAALGDFSTIHILITAYNVHPGIKNNIALIEASKAGHLELVDYLMNNPRVKPTDQRQYALKMAANNGHLEVLKRLLQCPNMDPSADQNYAVRTASVNGHFEIVKFLLQDERVDPTVKDHYAIRTASKNGHMDIVDLLLSHPHVNKSAVMHSAMKSRKACKTLMDRLNAIM